MATKFNVKQIDKPAPQWYRRLSNALIIFLIPGIVVIIAGWGLSDRLVNRWLLVLSFAPALVKGIGVMLGDSEYMKEEVNPDSISDNDSNG